MPERIQHGAAKTCNRLAPHVPSEAAHSPPPRLSTRYPYSK
jgi:hypothetical protein